MVIEITVETLLGTWVGEGSDSAWLVATVRHTLLFSAALMSPMNLAHHQEERISLFPAWSKTTTNPKRNPQALDHSLWPGRFGRVRKRWLRLRKPCVKGWSKEDVFP